MGKKSLDHKRLWRVRIILKTKPPYSQRVGKEVVRLVDSSDNPVFEIARKLGICLEPEIAAHLVHRVIACSFVHAL
jgi:hypothetical protein